MSLLHSDFCYNNYSVSTRCSTITNQKWQLNLEEILMLLQRNNTISWNKPMSVHELSEICETFNQTFFSPTDLLVVCRIKERFSRNWKIKSKIFLLIKAVHKTSTFTSNYYLKIFLLVTMLVLFFPNISECFKS